MKFGNIYFLWMFTLVPLLAVFFIWAFKHKMNLIERFVAKELKERLLQGVSFSRQKIKMVLLIVAVFFLILALIRPKWGFHWEEVKRKGVDIVIALDVSKSMLAQDISPNRLERAKMEIMDLLKIMEGDRISLVAFAGTSFMECPLTLDYGALRLFLDDLDTDLIPVPGTDLAGAIEKSLSAFDKGDKKSRVLIMITDGEGHTGDPLPLAEKAQQEGVKIYTVGIGQEGGAPIPDGQNGGFKKDAHGELILSKLDEEILQKIALKTGGSYIRSTSGEIGLEKVYEDIRKTVEDKELKSGKQKRFEERFQWPLMIAIIILVLEALFPERKRKKQHKFFIFLLLGIIGNFGGSFSSDASILSSKSGDATKLYDQKDYEGAVKKFIDAEIDQPQNEAIKFNMASTYYKMEQYEEAEKIFSKLAQTSADLKIQEKSFYNLGNVAYKQGKLPDAVELYKQALKIDAHDEDALYNLKFVQDEIKRRLEEMKKQQQQQQQNKSCDNPQSKEGQQEQKQEQKQDQQNQQDKQKQQQQQGEEKKEEKKEENKEGTAGKKEEKKESKQEEQAEAGQLSNGNKGEKKEMSKEEAERWLSTLDERGNRKQNLQKQMGEGRSYRTGKDW